ncbi:hypothetical protein [Nonomuraea typhae]|uniref:hypothetical protein n=1 Tax=Nonomuraea typhae TaxID=2603600 RepID=UPI0012FBD7AD|nr:hypothetical protein [Nonomuraea typhae]
MNRRLGIALAVAVPIAYGFGHIAMATANYVVLAAVLGYLLTMVAILLVVRRRQIRRRNRP